MVRHFRSKKAYRKFTAFVKIHHLSKHHPKYAIIRGKRHTIKRGRR